MIVPEPGGPPRPEDDGAEPSGLRRRWRLLILAGFALGLGAAAGALKDPFLFILAVQAIVLLVLAGLVRIFRPDTAFVILTVLLLAAQALRQRELSVVLGLGLVAWLIVLGWRSGVLRRKAVALPLLAAVLIAPPAWLLLSRHPDTAPAPTSRGAAATAAALRSLPYASHVDHGSEKKDGVLLLAESLAAPGLNLYNSYYKPGAFLMDMSGRVLHEWRPRVDATRWQHVALAPNGDLLVCVEDEGLMRLDWDSRVLWRAPMRSHHEIALTAAGDLVTLTSREEMARLGLAPVPIVDDSVVVLTPEGRIKRQISLFDVLKDELSLLNVLGIYARIANPQDLFWRAIDARLAHRLLLPRATAFDPFHTNAASVLEADVPGLGRRGEVLVSMRALDLVGLVDLESGKLTWHWGPGRLDQQHHPTLLADGHILVFDNGPKRGASRIVEVSPADGREVWEYRGTASEPFFSDWGGAAQRLPNGDTLVTETSAGRAFEVTPEGRVVWDFYNPDRQNDGKRASIYRMARVTDAGLIAVLRGLAAAEAGAPPTWRP